MGLFRSERKQNIASADVIERAMRSPEAYQEIRAEIVQKVADAKNEYRNALYEAVNALSGNIKDDRILALDEQLTDAEKRKAASEMAFVTAIDEGNEDAANTADTALAAIDAEIRRLKIQRNGILHSLVDKDAYIKKVEDADRNWKRVSYEETQYLASIDLAIWDYIKSFTELPIPPMKHYDPQMVSIATSRSFRGDMPYIPDTVLKQFEQLKRA